MRAAAVGAGADCPGKSHCCCDCCCSCCSLPWLVAKRKKLVVSFCWNKGSRVKTNESKKKRGKTTISLSHFFTGWQQTEQECCLQPVCLSGKSVCSLLIECAATTTTTTTISDGPSHPCSTTSTPKVTPPPQFSPSHNSTSTTSTASTETELSHSHVSLMAVVKSGLKVHKLLLQDGRQTPSEGGGYRSVETMPCATAKQLNCCTDYVKLQNTQDTLVLVVL